MKLTQSPRFALLGCTAASLFAAVDTQAALTARTDHRDTDDAGAQAKNANATTITAGHSPHAGGAQQLNIGAQGGVLTSAKKSGNKLGGEGSALGTIDAAALATIDDTSGAGICQRQGRHPEGGKITSHADRKESAWRDLPTQRNTNTNTPNLDED